jgi:hypothetical protein
VAELPRHPRIGFDAGVWLAAIASSVMNGGVGVAALYMPAAKHYREAARARVGMACAETDSAGAAQSA